VTHQKNRDLPDTSEREKWILITVAVVTLWMGIGSPYFTRRFATPCKTVLEQMNRNFLHEVAAPGTTPLDIRSVTDNSAERLATR
jgi:hypothetical protein